MYARRYASTYTYIHTHTRTHTQTHTQACMHTDKTVVVRAMTLLTQFQAPILQEGVTEFAVITA